MGRGGGVYAPNSNSILSPTSASRANANNGGGYAHSQSQLQGNGQRQGQSQSPAISNAHPHPPQLQPTLMCWTDQDTEGEVDAGKYLSLLPIFLFSSQIVQHPPSHILTFYRPFSTYRY